MKIKKAFPVFMSLLMVGGAFAGLAGCNKGGNGEQGTQHSHDYKWKDNGDGTHSEKCQNTEGCDTPVKGDAEAHADGNNDKKCDKCGVGMTSAPSDTSTPLPADKKIYVVGDSTVCSFTDDYYIPRYGYGTQLSEYLNVTSDQIVNLALSGRSSKSFLTESNYTTLTSSIGEGDYLIIGFGHNDEKSAEPARFTDPNGTHTEETTAKGTSFKYCLYQNYVKMAVDKGATPILCTPIVRYDTSGSYTGAKVHNTADGDYSEAIRALGETTGTTVVDLTTLTKNVYSADNAAAQYYHAHTSYTGTKPNETPTGRDDTHINKYGAKMVAYQLANAISGTENGLKKHVKSDISAPVKDVEYEAAKNTNYVVPDYTPFDPANTTAQNLTGNWFATVMGDVGGADKLANFNVSYAANKFTVGNTSGHGKFASGSDGFASAFMQIDAGKNFTASANVKVTNVGTTSNQTGFGMMLRDDILVNTHDNTIKSNYVAAGVLSLKGAVFSRENGALSGASGVNANAVAVGDTYEISITRVGQTVTVKVGETIKTYTDFDFTARDNGYMYLCLFANRGVTAEFSNVQFEITGDSQGA